VSARLKTQRKDRKVNWRPVSTLITPAFIFLTNHLNKRRMNWKRINMNFLRTTFIGGLCLSSLHFCWVILVALGIAQPLLDYVFKLHMLNSPFEVQPFSLLLATGLVGITFLIGCIYGALFYLIKSKFSD
jgi:hypothetical protein